CRRRFSSRHETVPLASLNFPPPSRCRIATSILDTFAPADHSPSRSAADLELKRGWFSFHVFRSRQNSLAALQSPGSWEVITSQLWARPAPPERSCCGYWNGEISPSQPCARLPRRDLLESPLSFAVNRFSWKN